MSQQIDIQRLPHREGGLSVLAFNTVAGPNTLRGFVDLHIVPWHFRILGCPAHCQGERRWVGLPGKPMTDRDGVPLRDETNGRVRYASFAAFDNKDTLRRFSDAAVAALDVYTNGAWSR